MTGRTGAERAPSPAGESDGRDPTSFADLLRGHRTARSLSQEELADRARITVNAVGALERGERRRPYPHTVRALSEALDLDEADRRLLVAALPGRTPPATARPVAGSPILPPPVPVVGRDGDVGAVSALLRRPERRLVTLTGPGGVGKTTLALLVAAAVRDNFPGGVTVVELADVIGADGVLPVIATAVGTPESSNDGTAAGLAPSLAQRRMLLVLDNLEHVLGCGPELAALVAACPDLVVLATSRAPLRVRAEREVRVDPLDRDDASRVLADRLAAAGAVFDDDAAVALAVLRDRADGLPLALELAASAAALLGPTALVERVDAARVGGPRDLPSRQRSMAVTLAWSHDLLTPPARSLLARLAVCAGGFSVSTAESIGADAPPATLAALAELVEHSLVMRLPPVEGTERFRLLEPVRQDAAARLGPHDRARARTGLAAAVLDTARCLADDLRGAQQAAAVRLLDADRGNLRVAVDHLIDEAPEAAAELLWHEYVHLAVGGHGREGRAWVDRLLELPLDDLARARCLAADTWFAHISEPRRAHRHAREALTLAQRVGDGALAAEAATFAMTTAFLSGDLAVAQEFEVEAERRVDPATEPWSHTWLLIVSGQIAQLAGDLERSAGRLRDAESAARRLGSPFELGSALNVRAVLAARCDRPGEAAALLAESVEHMAAVGNVWTLPYVLETLAGVAVGLGDLASGTRLFAASAVGAAEQAFSEDYPTTRDVVRRDLALARSGLGEAAFAAEWRAGRESGTEDVVRIADALRRRAGG